MTVPFIEESMKIFPIEIKLTKTPNINMAKPIERFNKIFSKLDIVPGRIICLDDKDEFLTKRISVQSLSSYLKWLKGEARR